MSAVGDIVSVHLIITPGQAQIMPQPPKFGIVRDVVAVVQTDVLWADSGLVTAITHPLGLADSGLDIISDASVAETNRLIGSWVRRAIDVAGAGQTSAEFQGRLRAVYKRTPDGSVPLSGADYATIQTDNGTFYEDLASTFEPVVGR